MTDIQGELIEYISREFLNGDGRGLDADTPLLELRILDSITIVALYAFVEDRYGVKLDNGITSPAEFVNVGALARLIRKRQNVL